MAINSVERFGLSRTQGKRRPDGARGIHASFLLGYAAYALAETAKQFTNEIFTDQRTGEHLILRSIETYFENNSHLSCQVWQTLMERLNFRVLNTFCDVDKGI